MDIVNTSIGQDRNEEDEGRKYVRLRKRGKVCGVCVLVWGWWVGEIGREGLE